MIRRKRKLVGSAIAATAMVLIAVPWSVAPTDDETWVMGDIERAADGFDGAFPRFDPRRRPRACGRVLWQETGRDNAPRSHVTSVSRRALPILQETLDGWAVFVVEDGPEGFEDQR